MRFVILILIILNSTFVALAQNKSDTYLETRELLTKMDLSHADKHLAKLFKEADVRMPDLVRALDDAEQKVRLNSQYVITYLADPKGLQAIDEWQKRQTGTFTAPVVKLLTKRIYLEGNDSDLVNLMRKNIGLLQIAEHGEKDISVELVAYNKRSRTVLFEIVQGNIFTEGWHTVIKFVDHKWRLVSDTLRWQS